jgi:hypothetical protein
MALEETWVPSCETHLVQPEEPVGKVLPQTQCAATHKSRQLLTKGVR